MYLTEHTLARALVNTLSSEDRLSSDINVALDIPRVIDAHSKGGIGHRNTSWYLRTRTLCSIYQGQQQVMNALKQPC